MDAAKDSCFPFNVVVLSFPDSRAQDASDGLLQELQARYGETTRFVATTDPYGCRVGSGGGTLQALTQAVTDNNIYPTNDSSSTAATTTSTTTTTTSSSILILHAGGQSSRCPTQMCAGKAATTFPTCHNTKGSTLMTPLHHWLALAGRLFVGLPVGSVVVLASDTLLRVPAVPLPVSSSSSTLDMASSASCSSSSSSDLIDWSSSAAGVVVLTVPAPLSTAQNHGVFVLEEEEDPAVHHSNDAPAASNRLPERQTQRCWTKGCIRVLQKPSLDVLRRQVAGGGDQSKGGDHATTAAWIDTGVLVFLPPAAQALWALTREPALYGCTVQGLQAMHGQQHRQEQQPLPVAGRTTPSSLLPEEDVASFARRGNALSIDLYTHILQALRVTTGKMRWEAYYDRFRHELSAPVARALYQHLCPLELRLWAHPEGRFLHLGTTRELLDFYLASTTTTKQAVTEHTLLLSLFAEDLGLQSRQQVVVSAERGGTVECHAESVLYHSVLSSGLNMSIGKGSLVEFVTLSDCPQAIDIGHGCWVSGLRGHAAQSVRIPDGMVVQEVSLTEKTRVYLVLGVDDPIKSVSTLYGRPLDRVMKAMGLTPRDLWGDREPKDHTLWHAMLHPVLCSDEEGSCHWPQLFDWLSHLDSPDPLVSHPSLAAWKQRERLSLAEIRQRADARVEHAYRESLKNLALPSARLRIRQEVLVHIPRFRESPTGGNSYSRQREVQTSWQKLYPSLESWLQFDMYDLLGSTAMHFANCWDECANEGLPLCTENQSSRDTLARALELVGKYEAFASDEEHAYLQQLVAVADNSIRSLALDGVFSTEDCRTMTRLFRSVVSICTRICIGVPGQDLVPVTRAPIFDSWVLATAPVRIDLAGGWTDTAPICYEHGSVGKLNIMKFKKPLHQCRSRRKTKSFQQ
jgi:fucokinase